MSKTIVITGASSGIGRSLALECAKRGYRVGITARRTDRLQTLMEEMTSINPHCAVKMASVDVNDVYEVGNALQTLFNDLGSVDIVVVNAGVNNLTAVGKGQLKEQLDIIQTNLLGAVATVDAAVTYFKAKGSGHVVGISSLASLTPIPKQAAYCATKAGFSMYMDSAAIELAKHNIHFTKILPGFVKTDIVDNMEQYPFLITAEQAAKEIAQHIEKKHSLGVVPAYPWKFLKPFLSNMPSGLWKYLKT